MYLPKNLTLILQKPTTAFSRLRVEAATMRMQSDFVTTHVPWFDGDDRAKAELNLYLERVEDVRQGQTPLEFWGKAGSQYPKLARIALLCLSVPLNSVSAERSFNQYSSVLRDDRRSIKVENLAMYHHLFQNSSMV